MGWKFIKNERYFPKCPSSFLKLLFISQSYVYAYWFAIIFRAMK